MDRRTWTRWTALVLAAIALTGCTRGGDDPGTDDGTGDDGSGPTGPGTTPGGGNGTAASDFNLTDSGSVAGAFEESWDIPVQSVAFRSATIQFSLAGVQAGAPVTARVHLSLLDPDGAAVKTTTLGLGGSGDSVTWSLTPADLATAGTYRLEATADSATPLPSGGLAEYELLASITY